MLDIESSCFNMKYMMACRLVGDNSQFIKRLVCLIRFVSPLPSELVLDVCYKRRASLSLVRYTSTILVVD